jgi:hypothetical protein
MKTSSCVGVTLIAASCLILAALCATPAAAQPAAGAAAVATPAPPAPQTEAAGAASAAGEQETTLIVVEQRGENRCIWLEVTAINLTTGECREFGSPCSVPPGWQITFCEP